MHARARRLRGDEEEVRGYRDALKLIHERHTKLSISEKTIKELHFLSRAKIGDAGKYKTKDSDIIEKYPDGRSRIRFKTVSAKQTATCMRDALVADMIAIVGSLDTVMGEVDR